MKSTPYKTTYSVFLFRLLHFILLLLQNLGRTLIKWKERGCSLVSVSVAFYEFSLVLILCLNLILTGILFNCSLIYLLFFFFAVTSRDSLLASLLDGVRASGNRDVCVKMKPTNRGLYSHYVTNMHGLYILAFSLLISTSHKRFKNQQRKC